MITLWKKGLVIFNMIDLNNLTKRGDFNSYGSSDYALFQDDCLKVMDYLIEQGIKVDAIITDPPYGKEVQND
mgnify:CR=1 FL=1